MFARLDPDGNGQIDLAEVKSQMQSADSVDLHGSKKLEDLTAADTDGDGMVSREEFDQMAPPPPPPPSQEMQQELFNRLDTDGDGQIDLTELKAQADQMAETDGRFLELLEQLEAADTDGDGKVTFEEYQQTMSAGTQDSASVETGLYTKDCSLTETANAVGTLVNQLV